jgi:hypothetical protein
MPLSFENEVTTTSKGHVYMGYNEVQDVQVGRTNLSFAFTDAGPSAVAENLLMNHQALVRTVVNRVRAAEIAT